MVPDTEVIKGTKIVSSACILAPLVVWVPLPLTSISILCIPLEMSYAFTSKYVYIHGGTLHTLFFTLILSLNNISYEILSLSVYKENTTYFEASQQDLL